MKTRAGAGGGNKLNVAVTDRACVIDTVHEPVPEHAPDQPANELLLDADGVNVTLVPYANDAEHVDPQLIPDGLLETVPLPVPIFDTDNVCGGNTLNVAVTDRACVIDTVHEPVPEHDPDQPANELLLDADGVNVTLVPSVKSASQVLPQSMPAGLLVTEPEPVPARDTDNVKLPAGGGTLNVAVTA